jgi:hypothetical protein
MKKCILHVHLMDFPSLGYRNGKFQSNGIHLCYWSKGLIIVNTMHLLKYFSNKPGFIYVNISIQCALGPIDPSTFDKFPSRRKENQIPSLVLKKGVVLLLHGGFPKGISNSLAIILWILILKQENMPRGIWFNDSECNSKLLKIKSSPPSINWIIKEIPFILKSSLCPLGPLIWFWNCIWML